MEGGCAGTARPHLVAGIWSEKIRARSCEGARRHAKGQGAPITVCRRSCRWATPQFPTPQQLFHVPGSQVWRPEMSNCSGAHD